jgi:hypothetical protein
MIDKAERCMLGSEVHRSLRAFFRGLFKGITVGFGIDSIWLKLISVAFCPKSRRVTEGFPNLSNHWNFGVQRDILTLTAPTYLVRTYLCKASGKILEKKMFAFSRQVSLRFRWPNHPGASRDMFIKWASTGNAHGAFQSTETNNLTCTRRELDGKSSLNLCLRFC